MGRYTFLIGSALGAAASAMTAYWTRSYIMLIPTVILVLSSLISGLLKVCQQKGITLVELLVVAGIIVTLFFMVGMPAH